MPGIAGIISLLPSERVQRDLAQMLRCMVHEPCYHSGIYINEHLGLYAGWVCHEGSFSDCMPVFNEKKDKVLIFTGEDFADFPSIRHLREQGHDFDSSNASYLIYLYEQDEEHFLQNLNGWFSGILVDIKQEKIILFNDRYGIQRIYFHESNDAFLFATEAKSLLRVCPELRRIDLDALGQYFVCGSVLQSRTLFPGVSLLPGSSAWEFRNAQCVRKETYFKPSVWENQPSCPPHLFYRKFRETFLNILPRYFSSNRLMAMSLTGGLDTRMIMASRVNAPNSLPCYTFGGIGDGETFDIRLARKVAEACHQTHHILRLGKDFLSKFAEYAEKTVYITDGCFDICGSHEVYLNKLARDIAPIRLTGNYGSEVLRGVSTFRPYTLGKQLLHRDFSPYVQRAHIAFADIIGKRDLSFSVFKEVPWHLYGFLVAAQSQLTLRTPYLDNDLVGLVYQAPTSPRTPLNISTHLITDGNPELMQIPTDRGCGGEANFLLSKFKNLFYSLTFKMDYYYNEGLPHSFAKFEDKFAQLNLEKYISGKHKFLHYRTWFRKELSSYAKEVLTDKSTVNRPYWGKSMEKMIGNHINGHENNLNDINVVLTVELIHRLLLEI
jgi:asparagine synthase (glutamine-hydrolysing)